MKPLAAWTRDLIQRVDQLTTWSETAHPPVIFWMSGFTFPTGFLTAVLQTSARQYNVNFYLCYSRLKRIRNAFFFLLILSLLTRYQWILCHGSLQ